MMAHVVGNAIRFSCPWFDVVEKDVDLGPPRGREPFWSVRTRHDYTAVLAVREDGLVPLVRIFRPALEAEVLELPSGSIEPGEDPEAAARRELLEETGCRAERLLALGSYIVDSGRMETQQWSFFAPGAVVTADPSADEGISLELVTPAELVQLTRDGSLRHSVHVALIGVAAIRGLIDL